MRCTHGATPCRNAKHPTERVVSANSTPTRSQQDRVHAAIDLCLALGLINVFLGGVVIVWLAREVCVATHLRPDAPTLVYIPTHIGRRTTPLEETSIAAIALHLRGECLYVPGAGELGSSTRQKRKESERQQCGAWVHLLERGTHAQAVDVPIGAVVVGEICGVNTQYTGSTTIHKPPPANSAHELGGTVAPHNTTARGVESAGGTAWGCIAREEPPHAHAGVADRPFPALATANTATSRPAAATYQHLPHRSQRPTWQRCVPIRRIHTDYRRVRSKEVASTLGSGSYGARDSEIPVQRPWKSTSSGSSGALRWVCAAKFIEKIM